ncbi:MAG: VOC family protein [Burkholderiales bacterium]
MSSVINWFDIPATDLDRAARFFETVLAISLIRENMLGARMAIFPSKPGEATGAIIARDGVTPGTTGSTIYLKAGADLSSALSRVEAAGGKVLHPKTFIKEGWGYFAIILDSEGNSIGLQSPN